MGGRIIVQQQKISTAERNWTNPLNVLQEANHYSFIKSAFTVFPLVRILCALLFDSRKNYQHFLDAERLEFQFLRQRRCLINPFRNLRFVEGSKAKHQVSSTVIILLNKFFFCNGNRDNVLARCDSIFPLLRCQGVWNKTCTQLSLSQILFQNPKNYNGGDIQRFCYHS